MRTPSATVLRVYSVTGDSRSPLTDSIPSPPPAASAPGSGPGVIDVRCGALVPGEPTAAHRCQLLAGHEGEHALMYCRAGHRTVRTWASDQPASVREHAAGQEARPWVPGLPSPAWTEEG